MNQPSLFKTVTRDERQEESRLNWIKSKCKGTIEACTGYGFYQSRSVKEFTELSSGNIGETPETDNTEINLEIKESGSSYSVEVETI